MKKISIHPLARCARFICRPTQHRTEPISVPFYVFVDLKVTLRWYFLLYKLTSQWYNSSEKE